jgi:autotransporter-associated beta strand protein
MLNSTNGSPVSLTKSGSGRLTLAGTNTYGNGTFLNGGTLIVDGILPAGTFAVGSGTTIGGNGIINNAVTIPSGSTLSPGDSLGTLTVNGSVSLQPGSTTRMELNKAAGTNDQVRVNGGLAYGGALIVTNLEGTLWAGDLFQIFNASTTSGSFSATSFPSLPAGFKWQWTPTSGTLSVISTVGLNATNITVGVSGNTLQLSWPPDHIGWHIETNMADITDANSWFPLAGSEATNQVTLPIAPSAPSIFFRLTFP